MKLSVPKLFNRAGTAVGAFLGGVTRGKYQAQIGSGWEGWDTSSRERTRPSKQIQSYDSGLNYGIRESLASEFRTLQQTFPLVGNITRKYARYCVGSCEAIWHTDDKKFNEAAATEWKSVMNLMDANGEDHFIDLTKQVVGEVIGPGDIFAQELDAAGYYQTRLIEGDRVGNYRGGPLNIDEPNIVGGIKLNPNGNGRRVAAIVWQRDQNGYTYRNPQEIPWQEIIHVCVRDRPDCVRPTTRWAPALDTLRDIKESKTDEQLAQKIYSRIVLSAKMRSGGAGVAAGITLQTGDGDTPGSAATSGSARPDVMDLGRGTWFFGYPDEELTAMIANRPTAGWQWFIELQIAEVAMALDLPSAVVWKMAGLPGPAVRFELTTANRTFQDVIGTLNRRWYRRCIGRAITKAMRAHRVPQNAQWYNFSVIQPSSITIDLGRESKVGLEEIDSGAGTITDYVGEDGKTAEQVIDRRGYEESLVLIAAKKYTVDPDRIRRPPQTSAQLEGQIQAQNQNGKVADE